MLAYIQTQLANTSVTDGDTTGKLCIGISLSVLASLPKTARYLCLVDSGAYAHVCNDLALFFKHTSLPHTYVTLPNNTKVQVAAVGSIRLNPNFVLTNVLYIPDFSVNLISVGALLYSKQYDVHFVDDCCVIQDKTLQKAIGRCDLVRGLFPFTNCVSAPNRDVLGSPIFFNSLPFSDAIRPSRNVVCSPLDVAKLWHTRMGHLSDNVLQLLSNKIPFQLPAKFHSDLCTVCPVSKQKRFPFSPQNNISHANFDLIHCDTWGPFAQITHDGFQYHNSG